MTPTLTSRSAHRGQPLTPTERLLRRKLLFHDALSLLSLTAISICIAILTYFFFHSFQEHRRVLEKRWFSRGEKAMAAGNPQFAVEDFRSALSLSAANPKYELALAEALAAANRNEEAYAYFSTLHDAKPGDGFLNLQLARLAVQREDTNEAISYYRAALTGLWYGRGTEQRFQIRLELAKYLMSMGRNVEAQGDLLAAEGNSLDQPAALLEVASLLRQANDPSDALSAYQRVEHHAAATPVQVLRSLQAQAQVATSMGQYKRAAEALYRYSAKSKEHPDAVTPEEKHAADEQREQLQRLLQLIAFHSLPPRQHAQRVLSGANTAHRRYSQCVAHLEPENVSGVDAASLATLGTQWAQMGRLTLPMLAGNASLQRFLLEWTSQVEILTAKVCGAPTGDDALLLQLAHTPDRSE